MIMAYYKCAFAKDAEARETTVKVRMEGTQSFIYMALKLWLLFIIFWFVS